MKRLLTALSAIAVMGSAFAASESSKAAVVQENVVQNRALLGKWVGVLPDSDSSQLTLALNISQDSNGVIHAMMRFLEVDEFTDFPVDVTVQNDTVKLECKAFATFEGILNDEGSEIHCQLPQPGAPALILKKDNNFIFAVHLRPQEPKRPFPYNEEEVRYSNSADATLAGILTLPKTDGPHPAVLLIASGGPNDRDETMYEHKPFFVLADHLTRKGIAVLRVDKRGVGQSVGNYAESTSEDFSNDVLAGIEYLKTRKEVNGQQIGLIGHSEGGMIASMAAAKSKDVAFIVLMASPGVKGEEVLYEQEALIARAFGVDEEQIERDCGLSKQMNTVVKNESDLTIAQQQLEDIIAPLIAEFPEEWRQAVAGSMKKEVDLRNSKWFRYFLTYDPSTSLKQITVPVLALNGELDLQISPQQNLPVIGKALQEAGNDDYTTIELPKLNHMFQTCDTGSIIEYKKIEETISPIALNMMSDWILKRTIGKQ